PPANVANPPIRRPVPCEERCDGPPKSCATAIVRRVVPFLAHHLSEEVVQAGCVVMGRHFCRAERQLSKRLMQRGCQSFIIRPASEAFRSLLRSTDLRHPLFHYEFAARKFASFSIIPACTFERQPILRPSAKNRSRAPQVYPTKRKEVRFGGQNDERFSAEVRNC